MAPGAQAQQSDVQSVIREQLDAFARDDIAAAFEFASPRLQQLFQTPENFGTMVRQGYPMVWRNQGVRFLDQREEAGRVLQKVMIADPEGRVHLLEYQLENGPSGWRISAVRFVEMAAPSV
jgi:hypothetical protein